MFDKQEYTKAYNEKNFSKLKNMVKTEKGVSSVYDAILLLIQNEVEEIKKKNVRG